MEHSDRSLTMLSDDGNGSRLWLDMDLDMVANESYDPESGESYGLNDDVDGWGYSKSECFISGEV